MSETYNTYDAKANRMRIDFGDTKDKLNEEIARQTIGIDSSIMEMRMRIADGICNRQERGDS